MISFKPEWAKDMDGEKYVAGFVREAALMLENDSNSNGASRGIDYALAAACEDADNVREAHDHLEFIIKQLQQARDNMRTDVIVWDAVNDAIEESALLEIAEETLNAK